MNEQREIISYEMDTVGFNNLQAVKARLYSDKPLSGDERRDLANIMDAALSRVVPIHE